MRISEIKKGMQIIGSRTSVRKKGSSKYSADIIIHRVMARSRNGSIRMISIDLTLRPLMISFIGIIVSVLI